MITLINEHKFDNPLWTPNNLATLPLAWVDVNQEVTLSGSNVTQWGNIGTGTDFTASTASRQPVASNTKPSITFTTDDVLETTTTTTIGISDVSIFIVCKINLINNTEDVLAWVGTTTGIPGRGRGFYRSANSSKIGFATWGNDVLSDLDFILNEYCIYTVVQSGRSISFARNGSINSKTLSSTPNTINNNYISLGSGGIVNSYFSNIDLCDVIILNYAATTNERQRIEGFLSHKRTITLVDGHPYKDNPPYV